jgi:hypothetical protein
MDPCVRDECTYLRLAGRMAEGKGMTASAGWLWAPGWPVLLGIFKWATGWAGTVKALQIPVAGANSVMLYILAGKVFGEGQRDDETYAKRRRVAGLVAAWMYAISLHQAFFAQRLWSEVVYTGVLLGGLLLFMRARDTMLQGPDTPRGGDARKALGAAAMLGFAVGICVLFRGVAQYMAPIFVVGLLWGRLRRGLAWGQAGALVVAMGLTVAPYSIHATEKFETFVLSDRTLGQMMWLGNNDFKPLTFDYGNGQLSQRAFKRTKNTGRKPCAKRSKAFELDACQVDAGKQWILANKAEFFRRMPMRVAQLLNPHSLLTRHLRWNRYPGIPWWLTEGLIATQALASMVVLFLGAAGLALRGKGGRGIVIAGILVYHVAAIAALAGLTRYRVPLEPLLMLFAAGIFADPRGSLKALRTWRAPLVGLTLLVVVPLVLWYLPAGWPGWRSW